MDPKQTIQLKRATEEDIPLLVDFLGNLFTLESDFEPDHERQRVANQTKSNASQAANVSHGAAPLLVAQE